MSSSSEGAAVIAGIVALGPAAVAAGALGAGWVLYQSGRLVYNGVLGIHRAMEEKERRQLAQQQLRKESAQRNYCHIQNLCKSFIADSQVDMKALFHDNAPPMLVSKLQQLISDIQMIESTTAVSDIEQIEAQNATHLVALDVALHQRQALLVEAKIPSLTVGEQSLTAYVSEMQCMLSAIALSPEARGTDVQALPPEQYARKKLWIRHAAVASEVRSAILAEQQRARRYPVSAKCEKSLQRLFDGLEHRLSKLNTPSASNDALQDGIYRAEQMLSQYRILVQSLDNQENEFAAKYDVYANACIALDLSGRDMHSFSGIEALEDALEEIKDFEKRAQLCATIYQKLGRDAYLCLAFDTEMKALGYPMLNQRLQDVLPKYTCKNGLEIPAHALDDKGGVTQMYEIDEYCDLQLIVHADGVTTLQTVMKGSDTNQTINTQKRHCERTAMLAEQLKRNWFVTCNITEVTPPDKVYKSPTGINEGMDEEMHEDEDIRAERYQHLK